MKTPGPWAVSPTKRPQGFPIVVITAHGLQVAAMNASPEDAALMASAPALLAALRGLAEAVEQFTNATPKDWPELFAARAAISQAQQGQTSEV